MLLSRWLNSLAGAPKASDIAATKRRYHASGHLAEWRGHGNQAEWPLVRGLRRFHSWLDKDHYGHIVIASWWFCFLFPQYLGWLVVVD